MVRSEHTAWTPPSLPDSIVLLGGEGFSYSSATNLTAETVPGIETKKTTTLLHAFFTGGGGFALRHRGDGACGIPDAGDTIVLTGGIIFTGGDAHQYVTRWVGGKNLFILLPPLGLSVSPVISFTKSYYDARPILIIIITTTIIIILMVIIIKEQWQ